MNTFSSYHPVVALVYFLSVLLITMFSTNPILLILALLGGISFYWSMVKGKEFWKNLGFYLLLFIVIALTNPLFSHNGATPLFFMNGNPVTLEAVLYGVNLAVMLIGVMYWFKCFNCIMTSDKLLFLFGKVSPKISLVISSALRFIPLFKVQGKNIRNGQKAMGLFASDSWTDKLRGNMRVYSSLVTWSLENAIDTGASMKARGYGLKGRSHFALFRFTYRDAVLLALIAIIDVVVICFMSGGKLEFSFYPTLLRFELEMDTLISYVAFALLSFMPFAVQVKEDILWKYYRSKI